MAVRDVVSRRALLAAVLAVAMGGMIVFLSPVIALVAPAMLAVLGLTVLVRWLIRWPDQPLAQRTNLKWTIAAFAAHLVFGLVVTDLSSSSDYFKTDALTYHSGAIQLLAHWETGVPGPIIAAGKEGFYYVLAGLYWVFGNHTAVGLVLNAALAAALVPLMSDLTRRLFGNNAERYIPPLVVLLPGMFVWTSQLLKEAAVVFLIALAATFAVRMSERVSPGVVVGMGICLPILFTFRGPVGLTVAAGFVIGIALSRRYVVSGVGAALVALSLVAIIVLAVGLGSSGYRHASGSNLREANQVRQDLARSADTGFGEDVDISTPRRAVTYLPIGLINFGFGPFPWQIQGLGHLPAAADVVVWWALLPSLWRGQRAARRLVGRRVLVLAVPAAVTSVLLALAVGNFGTVVRERTQVVVLLVPLIALGLAQRRVAPVDVEHEGRERLVEV